MSLNGKKILLGITGSIAAYKSITLLREFIKTGAEVKVVITPAAKEFISPLVLSTLSKHAVISEMFNDHTWSNHVELGRWADLMIIAPASCNTIAKMANGQCDNILLATYLSATCPVMIVPAMDEDMWKHPSTINNLQKLRSYGNEVMQVNTGELASGLFGPGRMAEPHEIMEHTSGHYFSEKVLSGKKVLVTAGPTYEAIDPVRFIGNHSSGKMGYAIAEAFAKKGAMVSLISGPSEQKVHHPNIKVQKVISAEEMLSAVRSVHASQHIMIMAAAVADYSPVTKAEQKIKKNGEGLTLELKRTPDILKTLGNEKRSDQLLVGFALETENEEANAEQKLKSKNADLIVLNSLNDAGAGFGTDTNKVKVFFKDGSQQELPLASKQQIAASLVKIIIDRYEKV